MENERKKVSFLEKIKSFFRRIFKKDNVISLPEPEGKKEIVEETKISLNTNKKEAMELYKKIKESIIPIETLTREQLIMFITLANEEIKILEKKIDNEITETNMYQREIEYYEAKLGEKA